MPSEKTRHTDQSDSLGLKSDGLLDERLGRKHMLNFRRAEAEAERAECAVVWPSPPIATMPAL